MPWHSPGVTASQLTLQPDLVFKPSVMNTSSTMLLVLVILGGREEPILWPPITMSPTEEEPQLFSTVCFRMRPQTPQMRHSSSLWFCPCFCPCPHFPHVLSQVFALALALYFAHLIEQNGGQGQGQNLGAKHEGNGGKGKNNWIWGQGQKEMTMWPVKIWDQGKRRWKYLKNRCYQFKGHSSTGRKSLQILEVGHITPTFTFLLSNKVKEKL